MNEMVKVSIDNIERMFIGGEAYIVKTLLELLAEADTSKIASEITSEQINNATIKYTIKH